MMLMMMIDDDDDDDDDDDADDDDDDDDDNYCSYSDKTSLLGAIDNLNYPGGGRNTTAALFSLFNNVFIPSNGDRSSAPDVVILITDGSPTVDPSQLTTGMLLIRNLGIKMRVVGVSNNVDENLIGQISSAQPQVRIVDGGLTFDAPLLDAFCSM